jgi:hypothetical protein
MKGLGFVKRLLDIIYPKGDYKSVGPRMSKYAQQYNLPSRKAARRAAIEKRRATRKVTKRV